MTKPRVVFYATSWCPYCARARSLLESKGAAIEEIDIDARPDARAEMIERSGRRTVPQIFIGSTHVGGCDDLYALDAAGGLDSLLESGA
ncbi:MAG TPA: glutaredoxin 3 [Steroidobacteraceae bacterium]|nr:glutaredoxin 3 [Steroidobacteraceae bacterium]